MPAPKRPKANAKRPVGPEFGGQLGFGGSPSRGRGRERFLRGHLRTIVLEIVKTKPRHGYDVIKAIGEEFHGFYSPSAGSVYPILRELEEQGFVASSSEGGKTVYTITKDGAREIKTNEDKFADMRDRLRDRFRELGRYREIMREMADMTHFVFGRLRENGKSDTATIKELRVAMANFKSEVEEIMARAGGRR